MFLAILATNAAIAVAVGVAERVSFDRGFREYMREREGERLQGIATQLASTWRSEGSFESLRGNEDRWRSYMRFGGEFGPFGDRPGPDGGDAMRGPPPREPPPGMPRGMGQGPPPRGFDRMPPGPPAREMPALLDADERLVVGSIDSDASRVTRPVTVDGKTVGFVAGVPMHEPFTGAERRLAQQQTRASYVIAALALLLAAGVAYFVARGLIAPVRRLAHATHRLAAGDYATRVTDARRDELGQLVADFNRLAQTLEANESLRRNLMADVSHELRTPLAVLRGELEAIEDGIRVLTPERLRSLQMEVATLAKLVDDLYDLSLADVGALRYHKERVDLVLLVDAAVGAFAERFSVLGLAVERPSASEGVVVEADPERLTQVLNNLFENSARYTSEGGRVRVAVERDDAGAHVDVMDSSPGVPDELLPRLFERLFRVDASRSRAGGGAGLGLALCRSLVEGHGGAIRAQRSPFGGLWVRVTLPAAT